MRASNLEVFGQSPADLVENQGHERLGATDLGWGHHEVEGCRSFAVDKVTDPRRGAAGSPGLSKTSPR